MYRSRPRGGWARVRGRISDYRSRRQDLVDAGLLDYEKESTAPLPASKGLKAWSDLSALLQSINNSQYGSYKRLRHSQYQYKQDFTLEFVHVQGDAYAPPSRVRIIAALDTTGLPAMRTRTERVATADYITRLAAAHISSHRMDLNAHREQANWAGPKGGALNINAPGQEVLERTSCIINVDSIELRLAVVLPAIGRNISGNHAWDIIGRNLPALMEHCLKYNSEAQHAGLQNHIFTVSNQESMRSQLAALGLVAFVANGSILPRQSGASAFPTASGESVPFQSPEKEELSSHESLQVHLMNTDGTSVSGMGIKSGVTVLTGGGYHGKSTLLAAIQYGVYNHIPGDGREYVVSDATAFKIRAEDGRSISGLDISPFISNLPGGKDTTQFSSTDASGSTSMAANVQEALESGSKLLLIDEDTAATNLLVRDDRMQMLIEEETITLLLSKVRALYEQHTVSTIIVIGGCGDYLDVAHTVIGMQQYLPQELNYRAQCVVAALPRYIKVIDQYGDLPRRYITLDQKTIGDRTPNARGRSFMALSTGSSDPVKNPAAGEDGVDLSGLEQLVEPGQVRCIAELLRFLASVGNSWRMVGMVEEIERTLISEGLDGMAAGWDYWGDLVEVRRFELAAAISRVRGLKVK